MDDTEAGRRPDAGAAGKVMQKEKQKSNYLAQGWLVLLLAGGFAAALAAVQVSLSGRIEQNKENETLGRIGELVPGAIAGRKTDINGMTAYEALDAGGKRVGWVIKGSGQGYSDVIELLIGVDAEVQKITGLYVLEHKETPGLGSKIRDDADWARQFAGKPVAEPLGVVKDGGQIASIASATISSRSVCQIVNNAIKQFKNAMAGRDTEAERVGDVVPGAAGGRKLSVAGMTVYEALDESGAIIGWAVVAAGDGYAGEDSIVLLIGLDAAAEKIAGLTVLSHGETPRLGDRICEQAWLRQFKGKDANRPLKPTKSVPRAGSNEIEVISGATVSSRSVCRIVNEATARLKGGFGKTTGTAP